MFENYVIAKQTKRAGWVTALIVGSVIVHGSVGGGLLIYSWLKIEKLEAPTANVHASFDLPPPPPPPKGRRHDQLEARKDDVKVKIKPVDTVQPEKRKEKDPAPVSDSSADEPEGDPNGEEGGVEGGVVGGQVGGVVGGVVTAPPPPPPPPPPPAKVETIAPTALEAQRISGNKDISPDDVTKTEISRSGKPRVVVPVKICLSDKGNVKTVTVLKASAYPKYDAKIVKEMKTWKYKPFLVDGKATPVCSAVTFVFVLKS